jgi:hypothetical protein
VWGETEEGESHLLRRVRLEDAVEVERPQPHVRRHGEHAAWRLVQREHLRHNPTKRRQAEGSQQKGQAPQRSVTTRSIAELMHHLIPINNRYGILRSYVPLNKYRVEPIKGVKGFNGRFE